MADPTKHLHIHGGTVITYIKSLFSVIKTRRTVAFAYGFMFAFVAFTVFLAFSPSQNSSSPWFMNMFSDGTRSSTQTTSAESYRSQFSSIFSYFFPQKPQHMMSLNSDSNITDRSYNNTVAVNEGYASVSNDTKSTGSSDEGNVLMPNQTTVAVNQSESLSAQRDSQENADSKENLVPALNSTITEDSSKNQTSSTMIPEAPKSVEANQNNNHNASFPGDSGVSKEENRGKVENDVWKKNVESNYTATLGKKKSSEAKSDVSGKQGMKDVIKSLMNCDLFDGEWVRDDSYPLYKPGSCSLIDEQFNCIVNGRPDTDYQKLKWKPKGCTLPRMNGRHMLKLIRGKRLVFVGDSLNRNMWESLICILKNSVKNPRKVYEAHGKVNFRGEAAYSFVLKDYNCTVEFFVSPFLVREWEMQDKSGLKKETLRLDLVGRSSYMFKDADFIVFNTGHWWTHEKTSRGVDYYQEGNHVYSQLNVLEAFRKALTTWGRWVDANVNPAKSMVFFRGYSVSHFSGGQWNSGGACDSETEPIKNDTYINPYPPKMMVLESVLEKMKTPVTYLNITRLTDYRKDAHPSIYRRLKVPDEEKREPLKYQDCSHWCLPGVPDAWNELLYAEILVRQYQKQRQKRP